MDSTQLDRFIRRRFTVGIDTPYAESGPQIPEATAEMTLHLFKVIYALCCSFRFSAKKIVVTQVKTKFNWLRVYVHFNDGVPDQARELIMNTISLFESHSKDMILEVDE